MAGLIAGGLAGAALLDAHDRGARLHRVDRALLLLLLADPAAREDLAALPIAERDRRLLAHRQATFGDAIACTATCAACGSPQEFTLSAAALIAAADAAVAPETLRLDDWEIDLRPLDSHALAAAAGAPDADAAARILVDSAIVAMRGPEIILPDPVRARIEARIAEREAGGDVAIDLACPDCGTTWTAPFDIGACFWAETDAAARRLIGEVATLAMRFGWSEAAILALPPARRAAYLAAAA